MYAFAFIAERTGNDRNGQDTHFFGNLGNHRSRTSTSTATHTGGDEQHIRAANSIFDGFAIFLCRSTADFRISTRTQTTGQISTQLDALGCVIFTQRLCISIGTNKFNTLDGVGNHVVNSVATAATQADYFDDRRACG